MKSSDEKTENEKIKIKLYDTFMKGNYDSCIQMLEEYSKYVKIMITQSPISKKAEMIDSIFENPLLTRSQKYSY